MRSVLYVLDGLFLLHPRFFFKLGSTVLPNLEINRFFSLFPLLPLTGLCESLKQTAHVSYLPLSASRNNDKTPKISFWV